MGRAGVPRKERRMSVIPMPIPGSSKSDAELIIENLDEKYTVSLKRDSVSIEAEGIGSNIGMAIAGLSMIQQAFAMTDESLQKNLADLLSEIESVTPE